MIASLRDKLSWVGRWFTRLETWIVILLVAAVTGFGLVQIILRNVFSTGLIWGDSFLRIAVLWICLLGAARATAEDKHISIEILPRLLSERSRFILKIITNALPLVVCAILVYSSWNFVENERLGGENAFAAIPVWCLQLIFPFSFAVMTIRYAGRLIGALIHGREGMEP